MARLLELNEGIPPRETIICFVLDSSQSMDSCRLPTVTGFNEYIATLKARPEPSVLTLYVFNSEQIRKVYDQQPIGQVENLSQATFRPMGMTPLYDAIAQAIVETDAVLRQRGSDLPVLLLIMTDGEENASQQATKDSIVALIQERERQGWTIGYLGANQDAWAVGGGLGIARGNTMSYHTQQMPAVMRSVGVASAAYLAGGSQVTASLFTGRRTDEDPGDSPTQDYPTTASE